MVGYLVGYFSWRNRFLLDKKEDKIAFRADFNIVIISASETSAIPFWVVLEDSQVSPLAILTFRSTNSSNSLPEDHSKFQYR
jgi:hypothetical protein